MSLQDFQNHPSLQIRAGIYSDLRSESKRNQTPRHPTRPGTDCHRAMTGYGGGYRALTSKVVQAKLT